jgi:hypothetical protein
LRHFATDIELDGADQVGQLFAFAFACSVKRVALIFCFCVQLLPFTPCLLRVARGVWRAAFFHP